MVQAMAMGLQVVAGGDMLTGSGKMYLSVGGILL